MTSFKGTNLIHLDINDFDMGTNTLKYKGNDVKGKWFCMIQGNFCGYCTQAKPEFLKAQKMAGKDVMFCTVQIDGTDAEQKLGKQMKNITNMKLNGVPAFVLFIDGKAQKLYEGNRDAPSLVQFVTNF